MTKLCEPDFTGSALKCRVDPTLRRVKFTRFVSIVVEPSTVSSVARQAFTAELRALCRPEEYDSSPADRQERGPETSAPSSSRIAPPPPWDAPAPGTTGPG